MSKAAEPPLAAPESAGESRVKAWSYTVLLLILGVVNWGDKTILGLAAQPLREELGMSASQIGLVGSAFFLTFTIGGFLAGPILRLTTLRWALVALSLIWAASMLPVVVAGTFAVLLISRMVLGLGEGPSSALVLTGIYGWHPPAKRGLPGALATAAASIAKIAIAPLLAVVMVAWGWRAGFIALAIAGIAWCVLWLPTWRDGPYSAATTAKSAAGGDERTVPLRAIVLSRTFLGGLAAVFAMYASVTVVLTWLPSYFEAGLGYSRVEAGIMFGFPSIASMALMFLSAGIGDRLLVRGASSRVLRGVLPAVGLLVCGATLATLPYITVPALAVAVVSIGYGFGSIVFPLFNAGLSEICPPKQMGNAMGIFLALMAVGGLVAPYLTGVIVDAAPTPAAGYALAFQVFGIAAILGGAVALALVNPVRDKATVMAMAR